MRYSPRRGPHCPAAGGRPVFADVDPLTFALSAQTVEAALTPRTAAVVLVDVRGLITPAASELRRLCAERGIALVEDASARARCHLLPASPRPERVRSRRQLLVLPGQADHLRRERHRADAVRLELKRQARVCRGQGEGSSSANHHVLHGYAWQIAEQAAATGSVHMHRLGEFMEQHGRGRRPRISSRPWRRWTVSPRSASPQAPRATVPSLHGRPAAHADRADFRRRLAAERQVRLAAEVDLLPLRPGGRSSPNSPGRRCRSPRACARGTYLPARALRYITRSIRCDQGDHRDISRIRRPRRRSEKGQGIPRRGHLR